MQDWLKDIIENRVNSETFHEKFPWAEKMIGCPHDSHYHAEGDPWIHTRMVVGSLKQTEAWQTMPEERRQIVHLAAWMHDIAKPATTEVYFCEKERRERVSQPGHAALGAAMAWQALIDAGCDPSLARDVHALVFWHQRPGFLLDQKNPLKRVIHYSHAAGGGNWRELLTLCRADTMGRICPDWRDTLDLYDLLEEEISGMGENAGADLLGEPWPFETDQALQAYLSGGKDASPYFTPFEAPKCRMALMSGLPGSGKDSFIRENLGHLPVISLDDLRDQMGVSWTDKQGAVLQAAFEKARTHLRAGQDFVWNATCISRVTRQKITALAKSYGAAIDAYSIDIPFDVIAARNASRERCVPQSVMEKLSAKREPITIEEVDRIYSVDASLKARCIVSIDKTDAGVDGPAI